MIIKDSTAPSPERRPNRSSAASNSTTPYQTYIVTHKVDPFVEYRRQHHDTIQTIEEYLDWLEIVKRLAPETIRLRRGHLGRLFNAPIVLDPAVGQRCMTLPDVMTPGFGRQTIRKLADELRDVCASEWVVSDLLSSLRVFCRYVEVSYILEDGTDLRARYGVLRCPIQDRDIKSRKSARPHGLPTPPVVREICRFVLHEWAPRQRKKGTAYRTAVMLIVALGTGLRGKELRRLLLAQPNLGSGLLYVPPSKNGLSREVFVEAWALEVLNWWIKEGRQLMLGDCFREPTSQAILFPHHDDGDKSLGAGGLSNANEKLLKDLRERALVLADFTYHDTRKTFATNYLEGGGDVLVLLDQCGWASTAMLGVYLSHADTRRQAERRQFVASMSPSRRPL